MARIFHSKWRDYIFSFHLSYVYSVEITVIQIILIMKISQECPFDGGLYIKHMYSFHTQLKNVMNFMYTNHGNEKIGLIFCVKIRIVTKGLNIKLVKL